MAARPSIRFRVLVRLTIRLPSGIQVQLERGFEPIEGDRPVEHHPAVDGPSVPWSRVA